MVSVRMFRLVTGDHCVDNRLVRSEGSRKTEITETVNRADTA